MADHRVEEHASSRYMIVATLARFRVALGFVFGVLVLILAQPTAKSLVIGMSIAAIGEAFRVWAAGHLRKSREVTVSGPYRWVAHPLYVGSSIMGVGLAIASASILVGALIGLYLVATLTAAMKNEEAYLRRAFGEQYDLYRSGVEAKRRERSAASMRRFSLQQAIDNREYRAIAGLGAAILLLIWKATYNGAFWRAAGTR
jgi:protein-S-isoprenylcysteine O-methyltransferase Ste14